MSNQPESLPSKASAEDLLPTFKAEETLPSGQSMKLVRPPSRPAPVSVEKAIPAVPSVPAVESKITLEPVPTDGRQRPIPPPSEPTQYRAIGVVRGTYHPSDEQFTRGNMVMADGSHVEAVLLGRVMSLVRNHLQLDQEHVWVVYPRTREREATLHLQIVGVWEPENLSNEPDSGELGDELTQDSIEEEVQEESTKVSTSEVSTSEVSTSEVSTSEVSTSEVSTSSDDGLQYVPSSEVDTDVFSIRGEIIAHEPENHKVSVKIQQVLRKKGEKEPSMKYFKLNLEGDLRGKVLGYFWDLDVKRDGQDLRIQSGTSIVLVMPKKYPKRPMMGGRRPLGGDGGNRRPGGGPPGRGGDRPPASPPPTRREGEVAPPKPVMKRKEDSVETKTPE
ncbi:MAG: hypothetical protein NT070_12670 [Cyanobacteria bacterium]|nr:hypothetical protein [Cyanobacteriota bacterium]